LTVAYCGELLLKSFEQQSFDYVHVGYYDVAKHTSVSQINRHHILADFAKTR